MFYPLSVITKTVKKMISEHQDIFLDKVLERQLSQCSSVLDVACGFDSPLGRVKKNFYSEGIDIFEKYIIESKKKKIHNQYRIGDVRKLDKFYKHKSFDIVIAIDVIEHFEKNEALKLIKSMESIAKKKVILLTPNGFIAQDAYDSNPHQIHKSGWDKQELEKLGYNVYGLRGLKCLKGEYANIKHRPWLFWGFCSFISEILFFPFPSLCFDLFAIKKVVKRNLHH